MPTLNPVFSRQQRAATRGAARIWIEEGLKNCGGRLKSPNLDAGGARFAGSLVFDARG